MSSHHHRAIVSAALGILIVDGVHAFEQDKAKCADGIGCFDPKSDKKPPAPQRSKPAPSPGLGKGIMDAPPGNFGGRARTPENLASANNECGSRLEAEANRNVGGTHYRSHPELNASQCIRLGTKSGLYGPGFANTCSYQVQFRFCAFRPKKGSWAEAFDCENTKGGTELIDPRSEIPAHTKDAEYFYWAGCRFPEGLPSDFKFTPWIGYEFRCMAWDQEKMTAALSTHRGTACETAEVARKTANKIEAERNAARQPSPVVAAAPPQRQAPASVAKPAATKVGVLVATYFGQMDARAQALYLRCQREVDAFIAARVSKMGISNETAMAQSASEMNMLVRYQPQEAQQFLATHYPRALNSNLAPVSGEGFAMVRCLEGGA